MADSFFDEETDFLLSQVDIDSVDSNWFDIETDFVLSQFNMDTVLDMDVTSGIFPYSQTICDEKVEASALNTEETGSTSSERFKFEANPTDVKKLQASYTPLNTQKNTRWGVNAWDQWGKWRNDRALSTGLKQSTPYVLVPPLTVDIEATELNYWMCRFVMEVRRQDGGEYPAESLRQLCISVWRYLRDTCRRYDLNIFDKSKPEFADLRECHDARMKELDVSVSTVKKQAEPFINTLEEDILWRSVFTTNDAACLQYAIYFYACKLFGLRAADEHADLIVDQFTFASDDVGQYIRFTGGKSKTVQGGIFHKKVSPKDIRQYSDDTNPRCVVALFRKYLSLIPKDGPFYRRPLATKATNGGIRYSLQKVGVHTIQKYMQRMCEIAGIEGFKTGHSGKVTTTTSLYQKGFDEQLIAGRTGHRSNAIRAYKRSSNSQLKAVSDALQPPKPPPSACETKASDVKKSNINANSSVSELTITKNNLSLNIKF